MTQISNNDELQEALIDCRVLLHRLCLTSRSARVKRWMETRSAFKDEPIHDPHQMDAGDWRALTAALERILTPELCTALASLESYMRLIRVTFNSPEVRAWLIRYNVTDEGLTAGTARQLEQTLRRVYDEQAI